MPEIKIKVFRLYGMFSPLSIIKAGTEIGKERCTYLESEVITYYIGNRPHV